MRSRRDMPWSKWRKEQDNFFSLLDGIACLITRISLDSHEAKSIRSGCDLSLSATIFRISRLPPVRSVLEETVMITN